jgi:hypothetical protein
MGREAVGVSRMWEGLLRLRTLALPPAQQGWLAACHGPAAKGLVRSATRSERHGRSATLSARTPDFAPRRLVLGPKCPTSRCIEGAE